MHFPMFPNMASIRNSFKPFKLLKVALGGDAASDSVPRAADERFNPAYEGRVPEPGEIAPGNNWRADETVLPCIPGLRTYGRTRYYSTPSYIPAPERRPPQPGYSLPNKWNPQPQTNNVNPATTSFGQDPYTPPYQRLNAGQPSPHFQTPAPSPENAQANFGYQGPDPQFFHTAHPPATHPPSNGMHCPTYPPAQPINNSASFPAPSNDYFATRNDYTSQPNIYAPQSNGYPPQPNDYAGQPNGYSTQPTDYSNTHPVQPQYILPASEQRLVSEPGAYNMSRENSWGTGTAMLANPWNQGYHG